MSIQNWPLLLHQLENWSLQRRLPTTFETYRRRKEPAWEVEDQLQRRSCCRLCRTLVSSSKLMKSLDMPRNRQPISILWLLISPVSCLLWGEFTCLLHSFVCTFKFGMSSLVKQLSRRKRKSLVWNCFEELTNVKKVNVCGYGWQRQNLWPSSGGKNATNFKLHLEVHHSEQFKELKESKQDKKASLKR